MKSGVYFLSCRMEQNRYIGALPAADLSALLLLTGAWDNEETANVGSAESGRKRRHGKQEQGAGRRARPDRARLRQVLDHETRPARGRRDRIDLDRLARPPHLPPPPRPAPRR